MSHILIVDDNGQNRYLLEVLLKRDGQKVSTANNGAEALDSALADAPDLVISDILMPVMDGFTLCHDWRLNERLKAIPFIFYTATYTEPKDEEFALSLGADRFVTKPQDPEVLIQIIRDVLSKPHAAASGKSGGVRQKEVVRLKKYSEALFRKLEKKISELEKTNQDLEHTIAERLRGEEALRRIEWLLTRRPGVESPQERQSDSYTPAYGDLTVLNTDRTILDAVGSRMLTDITGDYLGMLETSCAVHERNGDYAMAILSSAWCRFMDQASRALCGTADNREALSCGKWLCHESCWTKASKRSIEENRAVDIECEGGIRLYAVPIRTKNGVIGSINFGYADPPRDTEKLRELAVKYDTPIEELVRHAGSYGSRPTFIVELAKKRLETSARLIAEIVERKQAEIALQESESKFKRLYDSNIIGIIFWDTAGNIKQANGAFLQMVGYTEDDIILGKVRWKDITPPEYTPLDENALKEMAETGASTPFEKEYIRKDGIRIPILAGAALLHGKRDVGISFIQNITERKKAEEEVKTMTQHLWQAAKLATMGELAASIAHELNNPLATISLKIESLQTGLQENDPRRQSLTIVEKEIDRMARLVADLLQFSRRSQPQISTLDAREEIEKTLDLISYHLRKCNIEVQKDFASDARPILADRQQLRQVFLNLFTNAADAMPGGGTLEIRVSMADSSTKIVCEVSDTGSGIPPEILSKIMEPFFTTKPDGKGTGLGLPICRRIVRENNGVLRVKSEVGVGTTVTVTLPAAGGKIEPT